MIERCDLAADFSISRISTGLWQIADAERKGNVIDAHVSHKALDAYVNAGFTTFDMADHYGSAEVITGDYKKSNSLSREIQLLTKWVPPPGTITKKEVREAVQLSLRRLQSDQIDLLQFHAWDYANPSWLDGLFYLQELKEEGLIRHIGLTNVDAAHLRMAIVSGVDIVSNQISYSLLDQRACGAMTEVCREFGVKLLAFGVLSGGFLSERWLDQPEPQSDQLDTWSQMKYKRYIDIIGGWARLQDLLRSLHTIAMRHEVSISAVAAKYMLDQPAVGVIILGSRLGSNNYVTQNKKILSLNLTPEELDEIANLADRQEAVPGNCGDEYRQPPFLTAVGDLSHHLDKIPPPYESIVVDDHRSKVVSGTVWEDLAGYCRATRTGRRILVSGTTATHRDRLIGGNDPTSQTHFVIDKIKGAIESLGGSLNDVVRTRIYINDLDDWEPVARVHGERFKKIQPANTMVQAGIIGDEYLVEIEAEAVVS